MEVKNLYAPYQIELLKTDVFQNKVHRNTFFEFIFVLEGSGVQTINEHQLPYDADKLFLIFPEDRHSLKIESSTSMLFIRFSDSYLNTQSREWVKKMEYIFHNHNHMPGCILKNLTDIPLVRALVEALIREYVNKHPNQQDVVCQLINTVITIAARNITLQGKHVDEPPISDTTLPLINYIHEHIYQPESLKLPVIAKHFNISPTYISEYFKRSVGENIQQYISHYKLKMVETRLRYTTMRIGEIANEFGFTDESHLNRMFKAHKGVTPSYYRKEQASA
jgi:AraC-like DNA-binding protein